MTTLVYVELQDLQICIFAACIRNRKKKKTQKKKWEGRLDE
jgi:hypothetical protein